MLKMSKMLETLCETITTTKTKKSNDEEVQELVSFSYLNIHYIFS